MSSSAEIAGLAGTRPLYVRALSHRLNFSWAFAGNLVYAASQWAILVAMAKLGTVELVGQYALALALTAPVIVFTNLNLRAAQATDARREYQFRDYVALRMLSLFAAAILISGIALAYGLDGSTLLLTAMVMLGRTFDSLSDVVYGLMQQHEKLDRVGISRIVQGALQVVGFVGTFHWTGSLVLGAAVLATTSALVTVAYDFPGVRLVLRSVAAEEAAGSGSSPNLEYGRTWLSTVRRLAPKRNRLVHHVCLSPGPPAGLRC